MAFVTYGPDGGKVCAVWRVAEMRDLRSRNGFTILEMVWAVLVLAVLSAVYFFLVDSYRERRAGEQAAKVLMLAARVQEEFFAREHRYFDAEVSGNGDVVLVTPDGQKTNVQIPPKVILSLKSRKDKTGFTGYAFYMGSKVLHRYDSETGKMTTVSRTQDETG